jgi:hypothetical protein
MTRVRRTALLAVAAVVAAGCLLPGTANARLELKRIAKFADPVQTVAAPGPSSRGLLFVAERGGVVRIVKGGEPRRRPFLDISGIVKSTDL